MLELYKYSDKKYEIYCEVYKLDSCVLIDPYKWNKLFNPYYMEDCGIELEPG